MSFTKSIISVRNDARTTFVVKIPCNGYGGRLYELLCIEESKYRIWDNSNRIGERVAYPYGWLQ